MVGIVDVLLHLIPALVAHCGQGVVLTVHHALLQSGEHLAHVHDDHVCAKALGQTDMNGIVGHTQLLTLEVAHAGQLAVGTEGAHTVGHPAQQLQRLCGFHFLLQIVAQLSLVATACVLNIAEHKGKIRRGHFRRLRPHAGADNAHFHNAGFGVVVYDLFAAQHVRGVQLD